LQTLNLQHNSFKLDVDALEILILWQLDKVLYKFQNKICEWTNDNWRS